MSTLKSRLNKHFAVAAVAAAGAAAVGVTQNADADIVYSGAVNIPIPNNIDGVYMNIVTGATGSSGGGVAGWDINPYTAGVGTFNLWGPTANTWFAVGGNFNLAEGTMIDGPASAFFRPGGATNLAPQMNLNSSDNLLGFRFVNEANGNQVHYGWIRIQFGATAGDRAIVEYAYEDIAGVGIAAGVIPAPGALALLGLAGLVGTRRRRA